MFRLLIVEDIGDTLDQVTKYLQESIRDVEVVATSTIEDGKRSVDEAIRDRRPFQAVILDFHLPKRDRGENPEMDETLCDLVRTKMPNALVAHITGHKDDPQVRQHLQKSHAERVGADSFAIAKDEDGWVDRLGQNITMFLFSRPIRLQLDDLFGRESDVGSDPSALAERAVGIGLAHPTFALSRVCQDIVEHWANLDEHLKLRIKTLFRVIESDSGDKIKIGML